MNHLARSCLESGMSETLDQLRNHAPFPQALPALQFSIVNAEDQLIASRIFTAPDYLQEED